MQLDIKFVRQQFNQLQDEPDFVFASNAGGSYVCKQVNDLVEHYNRHTRVQPYSHFASSTAAGEAMDRAKQGWAAALNIDPSELTIGPSTSMNSYVMSQAIGDQWQSGDEIVVTNQGSHQLQREDSHQLSVRLQREVLEEAVAATRDNDLRCSPNQSTAPCVPLSKERFMECLPSIRSQHSLQTQPLAIPTSCTSMKR